MKAATLTNDTNVSISSAAVLSQLAIHDILLSKPDAIESYLTQHPSLGALLPEICTSIRASFGPATELVMKVYEDPEIEDRYLTLYIRQDRYEPELLERIDAVTGEFAGALESAPDFSW